MRSESVTPTTDGFPEDRSDVMHQTTPLSMRGVARSPTEHADQKVTSVVADEYRTCSEKVAAVERVVD